MVSSSVEFRGSVSADRRLQSRAVLGIVLMVSGLALYSLSDAFIKYLLESYSVSQTTLLRAGTRLIPLFMATFLFGGPRKVLRSQCSSLHLARLGVNLLYTFCFMYTFSLASLTTIYTFSYTSPFFMVILGALMLKEKVPLERWVAIGVGLFGVALAMQPGSEVVEKAALLVLVGTFLGAFNKILMRRLAATEHSLAIAIYPNLLMILTVLSFGLLSHIAPDSLSPYFTFSWKPMPWSDWGLFWVVGALTAGAQYGIAQALRFAEASTLAAFDYSTFFWVVALDFNWWKNIPDAYTLLGAAVIVGSNLYIFYRTRKERADQESLNPKFLKEEAI
jgi:drug/metabolite transporter (DMT)-like permease